MRLLPFLKPSNKVDTCGVNMGGGGSSYTLPKASASTLGGIKVGDGLTIENDGTLNALGSSYTLPKASANTLGGIKVGNGLTIENDGTLNASGSGGGLPDISTTEQLAGFKWNNKDVYVMSITGAYASSIDITTAFQIDKCMLVGSVSSGNDVVPINAYVNNTFYVSAYISNTATKTVVYFSASSSLTSGTVDLVLYYTKA